MALNLGAMIQSARTQQNPAGDFIANFQNQQDRGRAEEQRLFNNGMKIGELLAQFYGAGGMGAGGTGTAGGIGGIGGM